MNSTRLSDWLQVIGMFGVIASLIFVGLQMKQNHEIALSATYQARAQLVNDTNNSASSSPEFTSATAKIYSGRLDEITLNERVSLEYHLAASVGVFENIHFQHESGYLPDDHWDKTVDDMHCMFSLPLYRELIVGWSFRPAFEEVLNAAKKRATADPSDCWRYIDSSN